MASDRKEATKAITSQSSEEPELDLTLNQAHTLQHELELKREDHRHKETMRAAELGWVGRILGGEASASLTAAFIVVCVGLASTAGCFVAAYTQPSQEFWAKQSERMIAITMAALSFIFGKSPGRNKGRD
jgi:hypothetical protein